MAAMQGGQGSLWAPALAPCPSFWEQRPPFPARDNPSSSAAAVSVGLRSSPYTGLEGRMAGRPRRECPLVP